jgi:glycosyltransferase 2 family protein
LITLTSIIFMGYLTYKQWHNLNSFNWQFNFYILFLSFIFLIVIFYMDALGWHLILKSLNQTISLIDSMHIWLTSSLTRYLPGGFWAYLSRVSLAKEKNVGVSLSSVSLYLETILLSISSFVAGLPALLAATNLPLKFNPWMVFLILFLFSSFLHPRVISLLKFLPGRLGYFFNNFTPIKFSKIIQIYFFYTFFWIFFGLLFTFFIHSFYPVKLANSIYIASSLPFSFFIGYILFFFPGGIGVRETSMYFLLINYFPHELCLFISVGSRIWLIIAELISFLFLSIYKSACHKNSYRS